MEARQNSVLRRKRSLISNAHELLCVGIICLRVKRVTVYNTTLLDADSRKRCIFNITQTQELWFKLQLTGDAKDRYVLKWQTHRK